MNWLEESPSKILNGKDENGNRYVLQFAKDFKTRLGYELNISCPSCFFNEYNNYKNSFIMSDQKCDYVLKPIYEGIRMGTMVLSSKSISNERALDFAKNHPAGLKLFSKYPEGLEKEIGKKAPEPVSREALLKSMNREQLDEEAVKLDLNPEDYKNKTLILEAILLKEAKTDQEETDQADVDSKTE